jgi:transcriptional regulator with XRE-family HTH domain
MMVLGLDAKDLADKIGVSHQAVYGWINRKTKPKPRHLLGIANMLKMDVGEVIKEMYGAKEVYKIK